MSVVQIMLSNMEEEFDGVQFAHYVRRRWAVIAISCGVAIILAGGVSFLLPKRYTATASILIEPPAGNDPRGATAVSSVYLESLKTYERFAASDTAIATALRESGLEKEFEGVSIDAIKRSVLKISRPASTKIVEISATLGNPNDAQRLAQHLAEQSVALNRKLDRESSEDILVEARKALELARNRLQTAEQNRDGVIHTEGVEVLQNEVTDTNALRLNIEEELGKTRAALADAEAEARILQGSGEPADRTMFTAREVDAMRARVVSLETQATALARASADATTVLEGRRHRREPLDTELTVARADSEVAKNKLADVQASSAYRAERLEIMDPGVIPQRPSSPNILLNVMLAALVSLVVSVGYLALNFGYSRARSYPKPVREFSVR
jgi:capsular polysaccharide biosynthesis protein